VDINKLLVFDKKGSYFRLHADELRKNRRFYNSGKNILFNLKKQNIDSHIRLNKGILELNGIRPEYTNLFTYDRRYTPKEPQ
jgi:hypothetical protein